MADSITANVVISMPSQLFTMARSFKAAANGKIFIGKIDTDPTNLANQIQVYVENEDGSHVTVSQPISINAGGYPVYNGQIAKFVTVQGHSMAVLDAFNVQQFYYPNVLKYDPDQFSQMLAGTGGAAMVGTADGRNVQQHLDQNESDISGLKTTTTKIQSQQGNNHRYKVLFEMPLRFNAYDTVVAANGYTHLYASGHYIDHTANELWVFFAASGGDEAAWFVVYDLTTLVEKTYFKAGMRWTKAFSVRYSGGSRYLYSRSMSTLWLAKFNVTTLPSPGSSLTETTAPRNQVKYAFAGIMGDEMLVPYDAPTTNTTPYTNTYNILDADTWAFKRSIRMDSVGAGNEYGAYPYQYKNQGTVMTPGGIVMAFGGMTAASDTTRADSDLRIVQGVILKTEEGVTITTGLFDPYKGMQLLNAAGYSANRFEHEGVFYDQLTQKITTIWHYTDSPTGTFLIVEAFSGNNDALDMRSAAIIPRPKMGDIVRLFRSNFAVNYPNNPVTGDALPDVVDIINMMISQDMGGVEWYTSNFSALTFNGATLPGSCQVRLFRGTNTTFIMDVIGSGTNQRWLIQISSGSYVYTQMALFSVRYMFTNTVGMFYGTGSPEGVLAAGIGSTYHRTDGGGGSSFYVKESGSGNTGWVGK
ncbi:phage head-binding domain-containing protein [Atlantibacter hermannii]|uniref:phage head-binding domain-containing protein n=1 Tax=Atlantibacter hermannii TaxID=565 RepID=UPI0028978551|nr:phage head-binding domain-containing protein [Atlantibacter hermannii]